MDWTFALQRNQEPLQRIVAWLFTWLKLEIGGSVDTLPEHKRRTVLFVLRPSESALRRLVLVAMLVLSVTAPSVVNRGARLVRSARKSKQQQRTQSAPPSFKLIDPRKNFDLNPNKPKYAKGPGPRVTDFWSDDPVYDRTDLYAYLEKRQQRKDQPISAKSVCSRLNALHAALQDLPGQALRLAKLQARMARQWERTGKPNLPPLRPGLPPGFRRRQKHEVDELLVECHRLALMAQNEFRPPG